MVCLGNICRSPMAEGIMRSKIEEHGMDAIVDSAGTSAWHAGEQPDPRAISECLKNGVDLRKQRARQFTAADFDTFDYIFVMDASNYRDVMALAATEDDKNKVEMLLNMSNPGFNQAVPDPYYGGDDGFTNVYNLINNATDQIVKELQK